MTKDRKFEWELNWWKYGEGDLEVGEHYSIWEKNGYICLGNTGDLHEAVEIESREMMEEIIDRLRRAADDVFPLTTPEESINITAQGGNLASAGARHVNLDEVEWLDGPQTG